MGGNDVIGHVKSFPRTFRRGAVIHLRLLNEGNARLSRPRNYRVTTTGNPREKSPSSPTSA